MLGIDIIPALADNYIYFLSWENTTAVVDPGESQPVLDYLANKNLTLNYILITHHHNDHTQGIVHLKQLTGAKVIAYTKDFERIPEVDITVDTDFTLEQQLIKVLIIPGHTSGHIAYYIQDALFCGDTLFSLGCGRIFEGTMEEMFYSLQKLASLPKTTKVYCGHEYTLKNCQFALTLEPNNKLLQQKFIEIQHLRKQNVATIPSTIEEELLLNPFLRLSSKEIRTNLQLVNATDLEVFTALRKLKNKL